MAGFIVRRIIRGLLTTLFVITCVFFASRATGDPVAWMLPDDALPAQLAQVRQQLGLDRSPVEQFGFYIRNLSQGNFGDSFLEKRPVVDIVGDRIGATVRLAGLSLLLATLIGVPAGIIASRHHNTVIDRAIMSVSFLGQATPNFVVGILLIIVFSLFLQWLPSAGTGSGWKSYIMPVVTLGTASAASLARLTRSGMLDVLRQDYVRTSRAKGVKEILVVYKHALRNAVLPVLTMMGMQAAMLLAGSVIVETIFAWPGIGRMLVSAVTFKDFPVLQFGVLFLALIVIVINSLVDVLYATLDPRVRIS